jgi:hypothetical protein
MTHGKRFERRSVYPMTTAGVTLEVILAVAIPAVTLGAGIRAATPEEAIQAAVSRAAVAGAEAPEEMGRILKIIPKCSRCFTLLLL